MRLLIIGCGSIGTRHARNLNSFPGVEVITHDSEADRAAQVRDDLGVWSTTVLDQALDKRPDAVLICTPTYTHLELAERALDTGAHVFIEKPLSNSLEGICEFIERVDKGQQVVLVGCNLRFHPPVRQVQAWIDSGKIGRLQFARLQYGHYLPNWRATDYRHTYSAQNEQGGGVILDAIHELDLGLAWLGEVESVYCLATRLGDLEIDVEDTAEILLRSPKRAVAQIHIDYLRPERARTYELLGSAGMIRWMARGKRPEHSQVSCYQLETDKWETYEFESDLNEMYVEEMRHFLACLSGKAQPVMDAKRGQRVLSLALAAKHAAHVHREVPFAPNDHSEPTVGSKEKSDTSIAEEAR